MTRFELISLLENIQACGEVNYLNEAELIRAIRDLKDEAAYKENKTAGKTDLAAAIKYIFRACPKNIAYKGIITKNEKYYITDGHQAIRYTENVLVPGVPAAGPNVPDFEQIFVHSTDAEEVVNVPDITEIKSFIADTKLMNKGRKDKVMRPFIIQGKSGQIGVNPEYLLNAIKATGATTFRIGNYKSPLWFDNEDGTVEYLLLPVHINAQKAAA